MVSTQLVCHRVAYTQECIGKCHTSHAGSIGHLLTGLYISRLIVSGGQVVKYILHGLQCQAIGVIRSHYGSISLQSMGQNVNAGSAGQALGLAHHIVGIHDCHVRQQLVVSQRIFNSSLLVGNNGERSYLGAGTGGGGNGYKVGLLAHFRESIYTFPDIDKPHGHIHEVCFRMLVQHPHNLACVHGGAAAHSDNHIGLKLSHQLCSGLSICQGGIGLYIGEYGIGDTHLVETVGNNMGISVLVQEGVGYDKGSLLAHNFL